MMSSAWKLQVKQARFRGGSLRIASTTSSAVRVSRLSPSCVVLTSILLRFVCVALGSKCFRDVEHATDGVLPVLGRIGAPPKGYGKSTGSQGIEQRPGFQQPAAFLRAEHKRARSRVKRHPVLMHDEFGTEFVGVAVAKFDHLRKFVAGVDVQQGKGKFAGEEGLLRQAEHQGRIFSDGIQHRRIREFRGGFAENENTLRFERAEVLQFLARHQGLLPLCTRRSNLSHIHSCLRHLSCFLRERAERKQKTHLPRGSGGGFTSYSSSLGKSYVTSLPAPERTEQQHRQHAPEAKFRLAIRDMRMTIKLSVRDCNYSLQSFF